MICVWLFIFKRSFIIPIRNGDNALERSTKAPSDQKRGEFKEEIAAERRKNPFLWTSSQGAKKKLLLAPTLSGIFHCPQNSLFFSESLIAIDRWSNWHFLREIFRSGRTTKFHERDRRTRISYSREFYPWIRFFGCLEVSYLPLEFQTSFWYLPDLFGGCGNWRFHLEELCRVATVKLHSTINKIEPLWPRTREKFYYSLKKKESCVQWYSYIR